VHSVSVDGTEGEGAFATQNVTAGSYQNFIERDRFSHSEAAGATVDQTDNYGDAGSSATISPDASLSAVNGGSALPSEYRLEHNFPNPFNPMTEIRFSLPTESDVTLKIYSLIGQRVVTLASAIYAAGVQSVQWYARDESGTPVGSGIYFIKLTANPTDGSRTPFVEVRKMILLE
jgi:hypothetical protein